jgi:secreted trypsin-like serine protease
MERSSLILLLGCLYGLVGCGRIETSTGAHSDVSIVNGEIPKPEQNDERVASTVALTDDYNMNLKKSFCTGTLIAPRVVMTAGHCFRSGTFVSFDRNVTKNGLVKVVRMERHPNFDRETLQNDISLYLLASDAPSSHRPAIVYGGDLRVDDVLSVAGYGATAAGARDTGVLRQAEVFVKALSSAPTPELLLAGKNGEDTCQGDSGGPAYIHLGDRFEVVGVTSWGKGCGIEGHYVDVRAHKEFIKDTLAKFAQPK